MTIVLSNGYRNPEDGDLNFYANLNDNIERLNGHDHDGLNSEILVVTTQVVNSGSWGSPTNGIYSQTLTLPGGLLYDNVSIQARLSTGEVVYALIERGSSTEYIISTNDNSLAYAVVFSS